MSEPKSAAELLREAHEAARELSRAYLVGNTSLCDAAESNLMAAIDAAVEAARREGTDPTLHYHPICEDKRIEAEEAAFRRGAKQAAVPPLRCSLCGSDDPKVRKIIRICPGLMGSAEECDNEEFHEEDSR